LPRKIKSVSHAGHFKGKGDPRNHAVKGNKFAAGIQKNSCRNFLTQQLVATLNDFVTEDIIDEKTGKKSQRKMTKYAKCCEVLVDKAMAGDQDAFEFMMERIEGKVPNVVKGSIDHKHKIDEILPQLSDAELAALESATRKVLEAEGVKLIDVTPTVINERNQLNGPRT
jgi:hypothetical protein